MENKNASYRLFHFIACWVDLHAFIQICNSIFSSSGSDFRPWSFLALAIFVTGFVVIHGRMRNNHNNDSGDGSSKQYGTVNINIYNVYFNCQYSKQRIEININKLVLVFLQMIVPAIPELKCLRQTSVCRGLPQIETIKTK